MSLWILLYDIFDYSRQGLKPYDPEHPLQTYILTESINKRESFHCAAALKGKGLVYRSQFSVLTDFTEPQNG